MNQLNLFDAYREPTFDGKTCQEPHDQIRLGKQSKAVWEVVKDGKWRTLQRLREMTGYPEASISARLRDFRKPKFGGHKVERKRLGRESGLYFYRVVR